MTTTMAWLVLVAAGLLEVGWAVALKRANGFTRFWPSVVGVTTALLSFALLAYALTSLPVGTAYAVWVGIGTVGVAIVGIAFLNERASPLRLLFLALILAGIVGLRLTGA